MSNTFEFAERLGFESPFEFDDLTNDFNFIWTGVVDYNKLVDKFNAGSFIYNPDSLLRGMITKLSLRKNLENYLLGNSNKYPDWTWFISNTSKITYKNKEQEYFFDAFLSPYKGKTINKNKAVFSFNINYEKDFFKYRVLFPFNSYKNDNPFNKKYGIVIESKNFDELSLFLKEINISFDSKIMYQIRAAFNNEFYKAGRDRNKLDKVYEFAPQFVIESRRKFDIVSDLKNLLGGLVDETGSNEEKAVLNILTALNKKLKEKSDLKGNNDFLSILIDEKIGSFSVFELLYMKLNDRGGEDNFTKFVKMIYVFWANSSYKNEELYIDNEETGPNYLAYQNKKILGFYKNGFNFHFLPGYKRPTMFVTRQVKGKHHPKIVGKYHLFQPIQLPEVNQEGSLTLPSTPIPAFYLKAFDDKAAWDNFEKTAWLTLDAVTTLIGFGNLLKFRHLLKLHKANHVIKLKLGLATVEVASGALGTILNFVNECDPGAEKNNNGKKTFCQHLRDFLILLDIATLSVDGIDNLLRTQARKTRDVGYELIEKTKDVNKQKQVNKIVDDLDELSGILQESITLLNKNPAYKKAKTFVEKYKIFEKWMSADFSAMVRVYTGSTYIRLNKSLRGLGVNLDDELLAMQRVLNKALSKLPNSSYNGGFLKRSAYFSEKDLRKIFKEGGIYKEKGFFSVTHSDEALNSWLIDNPLQNVIFKVQGKNAKLIEEASMLPHEADLLFKSGTEFDVLSIKKIMHPLPSRRNDRIFEVILKEK